MKLKITAMFLVFLIVSTSFAYADIFDNIQTGVENTGEALSSFEGTDLIVNVDTYQPTILSEKAFESDQYGGYPIFATLTGVKTNPLMDLQDIQSINIRATGASSQYIRSVYHKRPTSGYFDLSNLGYMVLRLKNIKEDEVPRQLDINLTADIVFEIENGFGINENDLTLPVLTEEEFLSRKSEFSFWSGRGYVRLADVNGDTAQLVVYDGMMSKTTISLKEGQPSQKYFLSGGTPSFFFRDDEEDFIGRNLRDTYRIEINSLSGSKDKAKVEMLFNGEYKLKELVEGQYIYEGSKLKIKDVKITSSYDEVEIINEENGDRYVLRGGKFYIPSEKEEEDLTKYKFSEDIKYGNLIVKYSSIYGLDPALIAAVIEQESNFNQDSIGTSGEVGLMQLMPETAKEVGLNPVLEFKIPQSLNGYISELEKLKNKDNKYDTDQRFNPEKNIEGGVKYLNKKLEEFNENENLALAAYNAGTGNIRKNCPEDYTDCPNRKYVDDVLNRKDKYQNKFNEVAIGEESEKDDEEINDELNAKYKEIKIKEGALCSDYPNIYDNYNTFLNKLKENKNSELMSRYAKYMFNDIFDFAKSCKSKQEHDIITDKFNPLLENLNLVINEEIIQQKTNVNYIEGSSDYYFEKAIEYYRTIVDNHFDPTFNSNAYKAQLKISEIYDNYLNKYDNAIIEYKKLISLFDIGDSSLYEQKIKFLETRRDYKTDTLNIFEKGNSIILTLYDTEEAGKGNKATIKVNDESKDYSLEGNVHLGSTEWYLKEIKSENIIIAKMNKDGAEITRTLRIGRRDVIDGNSFVLENTEIDEQAYITILPGEERIKTESNFMLHIPVEPRLWKLSTEQIEDHISATEKAIDFLNKAVTTIENVYKWWSISCYGTFAYLWAKNVFWFGAKERSLARKTVMSSWNEECTNLVADKNAEVIYDSVFDCIERNKETIDADLDTAQSVYENYDDYNERVKELAKKTFSTDSLNKKYDEEAFSILLDEKLTDSIDEKSSTQDKRDSIILSYENIINDKEALRKEYGFDEKLFTGVDGVINPSEQSVASDVVPIANSRIYNNYVYASEDSIIPIYKITQKDGDEGYIDERGIFHKIQRVNEDINPVSSHIKKVLLDKNGKIDKISVDSVNYLRVSKRGADSLPLEVELWERHSDFGNENLALDTSKTGRVSGPFTIEECRRGKTSDRAGVDTLSSLKERYPNLQVTCDRLLNLDRESNLNLNKGDTIRDYIIESATLETGGLECFDIMEIDDCLTLFSVCDPVMCPVSRFTAGGTWQVDNVVSTGIFGSIFLGKNLWDFGRVPPEIGICVPGVDAGLKNYRSLLQGYQECLVARRDNGENVGICDTIRSVGVCKILWREGTAFFRLSGSALDALLGVLNKGTGGGEYAFFQSNIKKTGEFLNFFTNQYATTYFSAYRGASTDEIGEKLCEAAIYGKIPGSGSLLDQLTKPEGPVQFTGWFTEFPHSDVGGEVLSDYEVYYHIYAGEDREQIKYFVYLKDLDDLSKRLYITKTTGYLNRGDFVDETRTETTYSGYDELCIVVDNQEHCGFGRVSSDLIVDYVEDRNMENEIQNQVNKKQIKNEQECRGGSSVLSDPSVSELVDALYPNIGRNGLVRECSKENPGKGSNENNWADVGTCGTNDKGQELGRCWLSKQSYKDALSEYDLERRQGAEDFFKDLNINDNVKEIKEEITKLKSERTNIDKKSDSAEKDYLDIVDSFKDLDSQTINFDLSGEINFEIAETYYEIALFLNKKEIEEKPSEPTIETEIEDFDTTIQCEFEYQDGNLGRNIYFNYLVDNWNWHWNDLIPFSFTSEIYAYERISEDSLDSVKGIYKEIFNNFINQKPNYIKGVELLLITVSFSTDGIFDGKDSLRVYKNGEELVEYKQGKFKLNEALNQIKISCGISGEITQIITTETSNEIEQIKTDIEQHSDPTDLIQDITALRKIKNELSIKYADDVRRQSNLEYLDLELSNMLNNPEYEADVSLIKNQLIEITEILEYYDETKISSQPPSPPSVDENLKLVEESLEYVPLTGAKQEVESLKQVTLSLKEANNEISQSLADKAKKENSLSSIELQLNNFLSIEEDINSFDIERDLEKLKKLSEELNLETTPTPIVEVPKTCENIYPNHECVDTNLYECSDIHIGLCLGGNNIRCCIKGKEKKKDIPPNFLNEDFLKDKNKQFCDQYTCDIYSGNCLWWDCYSKECTPSFDVTKIIIDFGEEKITACGNENNKKVSPIAYGEDSIPIGTVMKIDEWVGGYNDDCSFKQSVTTDKYTNTRTPWNIDHSNPYGPAYANLVTAKKQKVWGISYNEGVTLHRQLHGTNGPVMGYNLLPPRVNINIQSILALDILDRDYTHGCIRNSNRFILWLKDHAKPGTLVYYINSDEGYSDDCSSYSSII